MGACCASSGSCSCKPKTAASEAPLPFREDAVLRDQVVVLRNRLGVFTLPLLTTRGRHLFSQSLFESSREIDAGFTRGVQEIAIDTQVGCLFGCLAVGGTHHLTPSDAQILCASSVRIKAANRLECSHPARVALRIGCTFAASALTRCFLTSSANSFAGMAALINHPCTASHPSARMNSSCTSDDTPSATIPNPRLCPSAMIARQIAASSGSTPMSFTNERSIFNVSSGKRFRD